MCGMSTQHGRERWVLSLCSEDLRSRPCGDSFWCLPQGKRTPVEKVLFQHGLNNVNLLYVGMHVLILLDLSYMSRFWVRGTVSILGPLAGCGCCWMPLPLPL